MPVIPVGRIARTSHPLGPSGAKVLALWSDKDSLAKRRRRLPFRDVGNRGDAGQPSRRNPLRTSFIGGLRSRPIEPPEFDTASFGQDAQSDFVAPFSWMSHGRPWSPLIVARVKSWKRPCHVSNGTSRAATTRDESSTTHPIKTTASSMESVTWVEEEPAQS